MTTEVLVRPHIDPFKQRDTKAKKVYARAVTVCIAAACQDQEEPRIILCSDTRLDFAEFGSTNTTVKVDVLGYSWCAQLAGGWSGAMYFRSLLKRIMQARQSAPKQLEDIESVVQEAFEEFLESCFCEDDGAYEVLLSGFLDEGPVLVGVSVQQKKLGLTLGDSFLSIGSGSTIASTLLRLRECNPSMKLSYATYLVYESKRAAEHDGSVGRFTALAIQAPGAGIRDRAYLKVMNEVGKAHLEAAYSGLWKVPFAEIPELTPAFFLDPAAPQSRQ
jgi:hypothetical protein